MSKKSFSKLIAVAIFAVISVMFSVFLLTNLNSNQAIADDVNSENASNEITVFDANGGAWSDGSTTVPIEETKGQYYILPSETPVNGDLVFAGWYTKSEGGTRITESSKILSTPYPNLYAHWEKYIHFNVLGSYGHWCFERHHVDESGKHVYEEMYSWQEDFPVASSFMVNKDNGHLEMLNLFSPTKKFVYDIIPVAYGTFSLDSWWYNDEQLIPGKAYQIGDEVDNVTIYCHYDIGDLGIPITINGGEGISTFNWSSYLNGELVSSDSLIPYTDIWVPGGSYKILEDGTIYGIFIDSALNEFEMFIKPVILDGYHFVGAKFKDGTDVEINKVYIPDETVENIEFTINCALIQPDVPSENPIESAAVTTTAQTSDSIGLETILILFIIACISSCYILRHQK